MGLIISFDFFFNMKESRYKLFIIGWFLWVTAGILPILSDVVENGLFQERLLVLNGINVSLGALFIALGIISY
ncbi:MAG: hypothetical protein ACFFDT_24130, partial [Candidatus Hodarchaeota archaeon]